RVDQKMDIASTISKTYVVEHLDPELEAWSALEYKTIAEECHNANSRFLLSSVPPSLQLPHDLVSVQGFSSGHESVEISFAEKKDRVCLLDPAAQEELSPDDALKFDVFLFGGILGTVG
ncbi:MAG: hypothetical protein Q9157_002874, partial [Trypethelium eluteriae]